MTVALLAEASSRIGHGHVTETFGVARVALRQGEKVKMVLNAAAPLALRRQSPVTPLLVPSFAPATSRRLAASFRREGISAVLTNFRRATEHQTAALMESGARLVCVDELGGQGLQCHAIVNNLFSPRVHYPAGPKGRRLFIGSRFISLALDFRRGRHAARDHQGPVRVAVVSFGGVDRTGTTLKVLRALHALGPRVKTVAVLGPGFSGRRRRLARQWRAPWVKILENVKSLAPLLRRADVGFTAGGNTLFEMACLGTPAIVFHEDPHERENGRAMARRGFGLWAGSGREVTPEKVKGSLAYFDDPRRRRRHAAVGRRLVDGRGAERIFAILKGRRT